jgi:hypothetical protein
MASRMGLLLFALALPTCAGAFTLTDDFESYDFGAFPSAQWLDVGLVDPTPPNPPDPSCVVERRTTAFDTQTKALFLGDFFAYSAGIYAMVPVNRYYEIAADVRVDRFADEAYSEFSDWAVALGFNTFWDGNDPAFWYSGQVYASTLTKTWRLFAAGPTASDDIELGLPVDVGFWQRVQLNIDAVTGEFHTRIWDMATGDLRLDRVDMIAGWTSADGFYDVVGIFDGELTPEATIPGLANVDNVAVKVVPEPAMVTFVVGGVLGIAAWRRRKP